MGGHGGWRMGAGTYLGASQARFVLTVFCVLPPNGQGLCHPGKAGVEAYANAAGTSHRMGGGNMPNALGGAIADFWCACAASRLEPPVHTASPHDDGSFLAYYEMVGHSSSS